MSYERFESVKIDREIMSTVRYCAQMTNTPVGRLVEELLREPLRLLLKGAGGGVAQLGKEHEKIAGQTR